MPESKPEPRLPEPLRREIRELYEQMQTPEHEAAVERFLRTPPRVKLDPNRGAPEP